MPNDARDALLSDTKKMLGKILKGQPGRLYLVPSAKKGGEAWLALVAHPKNPDGLLKKHIAAINAGSGGGKFACGQVYAEGKKLFFEVGEVAGKTPTITSPAAIRKTLKALQRESKIAALGKIAVRKPDSSTDDAAAGEADELSSAEIAEMLGADGLSGDDVEALRDPNQQGRLDRTLHLLTLMQDAARKETTFNPYLSEKEAEGLEQNMSAADLARLQAYLTSSWVSVRRRIHSNAETHCLKQPYNEDDTKTTVIFVPSAQGEAMLFEQLRRYLLKAFGGDTQDWWEVDGYERELAIDQVWMWFVEKVFQRGKAATAYFALGSHPLIEATAPARVDEWEANNANAAANIRDKLTEWHEHILGRTTDFIRDLGRREDSSAKVDDIILSMSGIAALTDKLGASLRQYRRTEVNQIFASVAGVNLWLDQVLVSNLVGELTEAILSILDGGSSRLLVRAGDSYDMIADLSDLGEVLEAPEAASDGVYARVDLSDLGMTDLPDLEDNQLKDGYLQIDPLDLDFSDEDADTDTAPDYEQLLIDQINDLPDNPDEELEQLVRQMSTVDDYDDDPELAALAQEVDEMSDEAFFTMQIQEELAVYVQRQMAKKKYKKSKNLPRLKAKINAYKTALIHKAREAFRAETGSDEHDREEARISALLKANRYAVAHAELLERKAEAMAEKMAKIAEKVQAVSDKLGEPIQKLSPDEQRELDEELKRLEAEHSAKETVITDEDRARITANARRSQLRRASSVSEVDAPEKKAKKRKGKGKKVAMLS